MRLELQGQIPWQSFGAVRRRLRYSGCRLLLFLNRNRNPRENENSRARIENGVVGINDECEYQSEFPWKCVLLVRVYPAGRIRKTIDPVRRSLLTQPTSEKFIVSLVRGADSDAQGDSKKRVKRSSFALCITHTGLYAEILARMFEQARLNRHA